MTHQIKRTILLSTVLIVVFIATQSFGASKVIIFYLDKNYQAVVKLERLGPMSDGMRAILAMYALQNGAGCWGGNENLRCVLTDSLNIGGQCSKKHINIIRTWFKKNIPEMSEYSDDIYKNIQKPGELEACCYKMPDSATFQRIWDIIRVTQNENNVIVDAHGTWLAREETGSFRYITEYRINKDSVVVVSHKKIYEWADCGDPPDLDTTQNGVTIYKHTKTVYDSTGGNIKADDSLIIWNKNEKNLCFSIDTYSNYFHNCGVAGRATNIKNNDYSFSQKKCRLVFTFLKDKVQVNVKGPRGNFCVNDDLGGGCGMNASVGSATYLRVLKP